MWYGRTGGARTRATAKRTYANNAPISSSIRLGGGHDVGMVRLCGGCVRIGIMVLQESIPFQWVLNALCVYLGVTSSRGCGRNKVSRGMTQGMDVDDNGRYSNTGITKWGQW